jgi:transposase InsO family protein
MPFRKRTALEERKEFIAAWRRDSLSFAELCREYGVSRKTGYKWTSRFDAEGESGLEERSRAPHQQANALSSDTVSQLVAVREKHPTWGPRKILAFLEKQKPSQPWPATSSIGALLHREGLSHPRRRRPRTPPSSEPLAHATEPNQVWSADFKGWFLCGDGQRCDPLTITDAHSRYLLRCRAVEKTDGAHVRSKFEAVFREYGMPCRIRTDNGPPFASTGLGGLSRLSMWWVRLGIQQERIAPGCPEQNGRHERMHLTLKQETASPPARTRAAQQAAFARFEREYNEQRPHEALGYQTPASIYVPSARPYPRRLAEWEYPDDYELRRVSQQGSFKWHTERTFLSEILGREVVGLKAIDENRYEVYWGPVLLGRFDSRQHRFTADNPPRSRRRTVR